MALSFIGKPISLISHSDVRYRGILAGIDPAASTIQLSNVYSMGTESRRPPNEFIPPVAEPYQYIIFRASEVKDLAVDEPTPVRSVHDDPAVLGASAPAPPGSYSPYMASPNMGQHKPPPQGYPPRQNMPQPMPPQQPLATQGQSPQQHPQQQQQQQRPAQQNRRPNNSVHTATASLETVERALGDLRVSNQNGANGRSGGGRRGGGPKAEQIKVPNTDFDFAGSNAKFDKAAIIAAATGGSSTSSNGKTDGESVDTNGDAKEAEDKAYNPKKSFFDTLSSSAHPGHGGPPGRGSGEVSRGRGGGRGGGRNRREEERERNITTFGEPGGVGLMGPGAYVGGWGGYGRRGGRPRRGGPAGANSGGHGATAAAAAGF
ncbi:hypothetical protein BDN72DRAFT_860461 [Pluteus cervinus]|uniref:Uncharacterized protein n=1 Tax=Pluteus cervinus TaxID=181527 RepID=A0ACD3AKD3_9AGAR|nr:hypothetical protein BDN72DRAFT_860461 [Pluteus cervinus]